MLCKIYYTKSIVCTLCGVFFEFGVSDGKQDKFFRKSVK